jgi:hypothetical protein
MKPSNAKAKTDRPRVISDTPAEQQNYNVADCVETASVDSFPASDPPAWVCGKARSESADQSDDKPC